MRTLQRNKTTLYYALYQGKVKATDGDGNYTGEETILYSDPIEMRANVSAGVGTAQAEQFGIAEQLDRVIVTDDVECPIDEHSVLFIGVDPSEGYNYIVRKVARSLNSVSIAVSKVRAS